MRRGSFGIFVLILISMLHVLVAVGVGGHEMRAAGEDRWTQETCRRVGRIFFDVGHGQIPGTGHYSCLSCPLCLASCQDDAEPREQFAISDPTLFASFVLPWTASEARPSVGRGASAHQARAPPFGA